LFSTFIAFACGSNGDESKVGGGTGASANNGSGAGTGIDINPSGSTTGNPGGGGSSVDESSACAKSSADGEPIQVDLYFMVDITGSMNCPVPDNGVACDPMISSPPATGESRWSVVSKALKAFVADPANQTLGVGLKFFPSRNNICNVNSYVMPTVEIGALSTTSQPLTAAIDMQTPNGSTPTVPSLTAAIQHATTWATQNPTHKVAVVYATDGQPNGCGVSNGNAMQEAMAVTQAAGVALKAALGTPAIPTYVLGVGPNLDNLNAIAQNGGTKAAFLVDTSGNAAAQLSAALASIRNTSASDCSYRIPPPPAGETLQDANVNVTFTNSAGVVTSVLQDPKDTPCSAGSGWQYSTDKTEITLCGKACSDVKADTGGKIKLLFGCATVVGSPPK